MIEEKLLSQIYDAAERHGVDPALFTALIETESSGRVHVKSRKGAAGLGQLRPIAVKEYNRVYGTKYTFNDVIEDPATNLNVSAGIYAHLKQRYGFNDEEALAAYNAGPSRVRRAQKAAERNPGIDWKGILPRETREYIPSVLNKIQKAQAPKKEREPQPQTQIEPLPQTLINQLIESKIEQTSAVADATRRGR